MENGLVRTPPMGFNTWYYFTDRYDEDLIKAIADKLVATGLRDLGYRYIQIDYGWCVNGKGYATRDENGDLLPDPVKFPSGMKALADYLHARDLKIGYYTDIGRIGVGNEEGSYGRYQQDVDRFASWDADLIKVDAGGGCVDYPDYEAAYRDFGKCIARNQRPMAYHVCCAGDFGSVNWGTDVGNFCRTSPDVSATIPTVNWDSTFFNLMATFDKNCRRPDMCKPGGFNDMDALMLTGGLTDEENKSYFTIFCVEASPLMLAIDLPNIDEKTLALISNPEVIAVNQDNRGLQAVKVAEEQPGLQVWNKPLMDENGKEARAVMLFNRSNEDADITARFADVNLSSVCTCRDLWEHRNLGTFTDSVTAHVPAHGVVLLRVVEAAKQTHDYRPPEHYDGNAFVIQDSETIESGADSAQ